VNLSSAGNDILEKRSNLGRRLPGWVKAAVPLITQLEGDRPGWLLNDVTAGLAIAAVALPTAVAYPAIAGLPPAVGLYASILPLVAYAIFGSSRQLIVGPDVATITILAASLSQVSATGSDEQRIILSAVFAVAVGLLCLFSAVLRLGFIANFLSRPILTGYLCGMSVTLLTGQIGRLTTVHIESAGLFRPLIELADRLQLIHLAELGIGPGCVSPAPPDQVAHASFAGAARRRRHRHPGVMAF
jgi:sulfate permease, SulP family